jgi:ubiquinone biosynthesis protein
MILVDGFFHADPHPGNVLVNLDTGRLTFIDTGMVGELGLRQRLNLIGLLYTSTRNDPTALAQSLRSLSKPFRATDSKGFDAAFARRLAPLMDVPAGQKLDLAGIMSTSLGLLRDAGYRPDPQLSLAMKALTQSAEFMKVLYPPGQAAEFGSKAVAMTRELASQTVTEERVTAFAKKQATYAAGAVAQQLPSLQEATGMWLRQYRAGRFQVTVDTSDLEPRIAQLRGITHTLTLGLVVVGVLIASAIATNAPPSAGLPALRSAALIICVVALGVAAVLILTLGWQTLRRARSPGDDARTRH